MSACYLRLGDDPLDDAKRYPSVAAATREFARVARQLERFGQPIGGTIHVAPCRSVLDEYPDLALSLGPRGGVRREAC